MGEGNCESKIASRQWGVNFCHETSICLAVPSGFVWDYNTAKGTLVYTCVNTRVSTCGSPFVGALVGHISLSAALCFTESFSFLFQGHWGFCKEKNPCFLGGFPLVRKLEKAVAVSGVCSGVLQEDSGKVPGKLLEKFSRITKCYKF